jgi:hypothetical protein
MYRKIITPIALITALGGCASKNQVSTAGSLNNTQSLAEARLASDFKRQGIRVIYGTFGGLEAIEATGIAPVWGNSASAAREAFRVAELEAKKSLSDFINQESIRSTTSVTIISRNLEKARDERNSKGFPYRAASDPITSSDEEKLAERGSDRGEISSRVRDEALQIASRVSSEISTRNQGILTGLRMVEGNVINEGREVRVVLRWSRQDEDARKQIRKQMSQ